MSEPFLGKSTHCFCKYNNESTNKIDKKRQDNAGK